MSIQITFTDNAFSVLLILAVLIGIAAICSNDSKKNVKQRQENNTDEETPSSETETQQETQK